MCANYKYTGLVARSKPAIIMLEEYKDTDKYDIFCVNWHENTQINLNVLRGLKTLERFHFLTPKKFPGKCQ